MGMRTWLGSDVVGDTDGETVGSEVVGDTEGETVGSEVVSDTDGVTGAAVVSTPMVRTVSVVWTIVLTWMVVENPSNMNFLRSRTSFSQSSSSIWSALLPPQANPSAEMLRSSAASASHCDEWRFGNMSVTSR